MRKLISLALVAPVLLSGTLLVGCDRTLKDEESVKVKDNGTVEKKQEKVTEKSDGTVVKEESKSVNH